jgi:dTDP-4-dehydrorhamnose 3,5-epimerase
MRPMKLDVLPMSLAGVCLIRSPRFADQRGFFAETYVRQDFVAAGLKNDFIQDNQSASALAGTIRGLHFQIPPFAQAKLVRVLRGRILDVVIDLRRSSLNYGKHVAVELSAESGDQLFVPAGFAHGFCTLIDDTEVFYKVDAGYSSAHDRGLNWADPALNIDWPVPPLNAVLSDKDKALPSLNALPPYFD